MANEIATSSDADPWFDDNSSQCLQTDGLQLSFVEFGNDPIPLNFSVTALDALLSIGCDCKDVLGANGINESNLVTCAAFELSHGILAEVLVTLAFALIVACAVAGNATVIWIILAHRRMRTVTNYFLLNLALADMSISVLNVIFSYTQNFYYRWFFGLPYCYVSNMMGVAPTVASSTTLMVMSWERYMVIVFPMRRRLSRHESLAAIASIWLFAIGSAIPNCALTDYLTYVRLKNTYVSDDNVNRSTVDLVHACSVDFSNRFATMLVCLFCLISVSVIVFVLIIILGMLIYFHFIHSHPQITPQIETVTLPMLIPMLKSYSWYLLFVQYVLPLFILSYTYLFIVRALWFAPGIGAHKHAEAMAAKKKVVKMLSVVVLVFMVCWLPYQLYFAVLVEFMSKMEPKLAQMTYLCIYWLAMSTTMWTPIVYCYLSTSFRVGFRYAWRIVPRIGISRDVYEASDLFERRYGPRSSKPSNCHLSYERSKQLVTLGESSAPCKVKC